MTRRLLTEAQWAEELHNFRFTAFRLELQDSYAEPEEDHLYAAWLRGEEPSPLEEVPELKEWFARVAHHVRQGKRIERVRVQREPPTPYQRFERWLDTWNRRAGETMRYMTWDHAHETGLLPAAGNEDWWLYDSARLLVMRFDPHTGQRVENELVTDPRIVVQACAWRDLAVHHSVRAAPGVAAQ